MAIAETLTLDTIRKAHTIVQEQAHRTPVLLCPDLSRTVQSAIFGETDTAYTQDPKVELFFKCENFQKAGSFKDRKSVV